MAGKSIIASHLKRVKASPASIATESQRRAFLAIPENDSFDDAERLVPRISYESLHLLSVDTFRNWILRAEILEELYDSLSTYALEKGAFDKIILDFQLGVSKKKIPTDGLIRPLEYIWAVMGELDIHPTISSESEGWNTDAALMARQRDPKRFTPGGPTARPVFAYDVRRHLMREFATSVIIFNASEAVLLTGWAYPGGRIPFVSPDQNVPTIANTMFVGWPDLTEPLHGIDDGSMLAQRLGTMDAAVFIEPSISATQEALLAVAQQESRRYQVRTEAMVLVPSGPYVAIMFSVEPRLTIRTELNVSVGNIKWSPQAMLCARALFRFLKRMSRGLLAANMSSEGNNYVPTALQRLALIWLLQTYTPAIPDRYFEDKHSAKFNVLLIFMYMHMVTWGALPLKRWTDGKEVLARLSSAQNWVEMLNRLTLPDKEPIAPADIEVAGILIPMV